MKRRVDPPFTRGGGGGIGSLPFGPPTWTFRLPLDFGFGCLFLTLRRRLAGGLTATFDPETA